MLASNRMQCRAAAVVISDLILILYFLLFKNFFNRQLSADSLFPTSDVKHAHINISFIAIKQSNNADN